ncbi:hypothetical protein BU26DRAFT_214208 [Trematosphaeria pertusa]|uniref:Ubiquitin-conjugating enzyme E2-binding protein n=1 Tax=Trematosphaeria pertusa TaxID=390896 RepID=A0A6A6IT97_9PLEO|nr:uncharacterized protein BU26DRAFT_214208 [Trematosphaeria pertusa]KAF2253072.1 hypothetical protein BU26DRAFT_214208 [Trematosphaeria pertusa]
MSHSTLPASAYEALELPPATIEILTNPKPGDPLAPEASPNLLQGAQKPEQPLAPNESSIILYAELLLHIRTVTLFASLRSFHTRETKAQLATDGFSITVTHEGESATIHLPIKVKGGGDAALSLPAQPPSKELTLRLQIEEKEGTDLLGTLRSEQRNANLVPWDGASLNHIRAVEIRCKSCQGVIAPASKVGEWRDLPNENWAEMMDFWHCHKPDEHHLHDHNRHAIVGKKGYAAGNRLKAVDGVGFVDLATFLLKEQDCEGAESPSECDSQDSTLFCKQCKHMLGTKDASSDGWRIWKWCISIASGSSSRPSIYSIQKWISARLLFLTENQGVRKFHVHPDTDSPQTAPISSLLIWVFTPDLFYSSSIPSDDRNGPTRSMKVFYQSQTYTPPQTGEPESASIEDVAFPKELFEALERTLKESQKLVPASARRFQGWEVGLLERFDLGDMKSLALEQCDQSTQQIDASA